MEDDRKREGNKWKGRENGEAGGEYATRVRAVESLQCVRIMWGKPR